jgi:CubicO group peptidase (beta-lactamase class C family)
LPRCRDGNWCCDWAWSAGGYLPGILTHVYRKGHLVHTGICGHMDIERDKPMREDAIFRIYSMSKPITAVALMMLVEEGLIGLDDVVHSHIPAWRNLGIYASGMPSLLPDALPSFVGRSGTTSQTTPWYPKRVYFTRLPHSFLGMRPV